MYLLFRSVDQKQLGIIKVIGSWMEYSIGYVPDSHVEIVEYRHLNAKVIPEDVAWAWMFMGAFRGYISIRTGTPQNERLQVLQSEEATGEKVRYDLTDSDIANTTTLMKELMRFKLDEIYDKRMVQLNMGVSELELSSWAQQKAEASAYTADPSSATPLLASLASARGITLEEMVAKVNSAVSAYNNSVATLLASKQLVETEIKACTTIADCCRLLHNRFEVQMSIHQMEAEGITYSSRFDV